MKLREVICQGESLLTEQHIEDAHLECEYLLRHVLNIGKASLYARLGDFLTQMEERKFWALVSSRLTHKPLAYILKQCYFYGMEYHIEQQALIPRPETELLVEEALRFATHHPPAGHPMLIADIGTGSGVLAITLAVHLPYSKVYASDISPAALEVANINRHRHRVVERVHLLKGNLLEPLPEPVNIIVANLPYVRKEDLNQLAPEIQWFEPLMALDGGKDGLDVIREFLCQSRDKLASPGIILLEVGLGQARRVRTIAEAYFSGKNIDVIPDLSGIDRVVRILHT